MSESYLSEIRLFSFAFAPRGWAQCNGQLMPVAQNQALFSLIGTTYGGDGVTTFALPDLRGRSPLDVDHAHQIGQARGASAHTLTSSEIAPHTHSLAVAAAATSIAPAGALLASPGKPAFAAPTSGADVAMAPQSVQGGGGNQPHNNMAPYLTLNFCITIAGIYPSRP